VIEVIAPSWPTISLPDGDDFSFMWGFLPLVGP
jgi:hypothetical protein